MAAYKTDFPSIIDLCPGPNLVFWTGNLKPILVQRFTKPWQRDISLFANPFKPNETIIQFTPHLKPTKQVIYPQHNPTSMPGVTAPSPMDPEDRYANLDNAIRIILTQHGTFKKDFGYIVKFFHELGHKDVTLKFIIQMWELYKDSEHCGDGYVRGLKVRWPVEMEEADAKADWERANAAKQ
ncbi:hypothetical protein MMC34_000813 [Xylographa carneopallida]|nr:hypothetical protein [Xylographa carneopallida]